MASNIRMNRCIVIAFLIAILASLLFICSVGASGNNGTFQLNQLPNAPTNPLCEGQVNPIKITTMTPTFSWTFSDSDGGDTQGGFNIVVYNGGEIWNCTVKSSTPSIVYNGSALSRGTTYNWKVRTYDNYEGTWGPFCGAQTFKINSLPTATSPSPANQSTGIALKPTLSWTFGDADGESQVGKHVQLSHFAAFNSTIEDINCSTGCEGKELSYIDVSTELTRNTKYYWRVQVKDQSNEWSAWQGRWEFTTTNITVNGIRTYDSTYVQKSTFIPGQKLVIRYNVTNIENMNNTYISIIDPFGVKRLDHEGVASVQDAFTSDSNWNEDYANRWNINANTYQHGANGGSGQYGAYSLIKTSVLANQTNLTMQVKTDIDFSNEDMERLIFRWHDSRNYSAAFISETYSVIGIEEIIDGVRYKEETSRLFSEDTWYTLKVAVQGNSATVYVDGLSMVTKTLSRNNAGRIGLGTDTGWIYYDDFSIGYNASRVVGPITNGYQYEFNYTIPNNESIAGTWTINASATSGGSVGYSTKTFDVLAEAPLIKSITTYNSTYATTTSFINGNKVTTRTQIAESDGRTAITICKITIKNPASTVKVNNVSMSDVGDITNGNIYEYNYTIPYETASKGTWNITIFTQDNETHGKLGYKSFTDILGEPTVTVLKTYNSVASEKTLFNLSESMKIRATITAERGRSNISYCKVTIKAPNGTSMVTNATMTDIGDVTDGNIYNYDYAMPSTQSGYGTWTITIYSTDYYYGTSKQSHFVLVWADTAYQHRTKIALEEKFGIDREHEPLGYDFTLSSAVCGGSDKLKIVNEKGEVMPFKVQKKTGNNYYITYVANISADSSLNYYVYYNLTGTQAVSYTTYNNAATNNLTVSETNYTLTYKATGTNITFGKSVAVGDPDKDGQNEVIVVGRTGGEGKHYCFVWIYNLTFTDEDHATSTLEAETKWNNSGSGMAFGYSVTICDIDKDGTDEIIVGGTVYDGIRNKAQLKILDYTAGVITVEASSTWYDDAAGDTVVYGVKCADVDNDNTIEILTTGITGTNNARAQFAIHNYTGGTIKHEFFHNQSLATNANNNWSELYSIDVGDLYNELDNYPEVVVAGEGFDSAHTINAWFEIFRYNGTSWVLDRSKNWYTGELSELFSCAIGDPDNDGSNEMVTSGNYFDGVRDVAMYKVWYSTGAGYPKTLNEDTTAAQNWYVYGYSSALTCLINDADNDTMNEIVTVGFQNDGSMDRGDYKIRQYNGTTTITEYNELWLKDKARRSGDFGDAAKLYDINGDGFKELVDTGRYDLTPPTGTYMRVQSIGGVKQTISVSTQQEVLPPNSPTSVSSVSANKTSSQIKLSWTKASYANNTIVICKKGSYPTSRLDGTQEYNGTGTSTIVTGLSTGTHYYFRLWSWRTGSSAYSEDYGQLDGWTNPGTPTIDANNPTYNSINIDITKGTNATNTYIMQNDTTNPVNRNTGKFVYNSTGASAPDTGLERKTTYHYSAWAYSSDSGLWSDSYGTDNLATTAASPIVTTNASTGVEETNTTLHGYLSDSGGEACSAGFYYDTESAGETNNVSATGSYNSGNGFLKNVGSLTKGETYYYSAWAKNTIYFVKASNEKVFLTKSDAPTSLGGTADHNSVSLSWTEASCGIGETIGTRIQYQVGSSPSSINEGNNAYNGTSESAVAAGLTQNTHYYFSAWAWVRNEGEALFQWSDAYDTFDIWTTPAPPSSLSVTTTETTSLNISWNNVGQNTIVIRNESGWPQYPLSRTNGTSIYNNTGSYFVDTGLEQGTKYYYSVWTFNATRHAFSLTYGSANNTVPHTELDIVITPPTYDFGIIAIPGSNWTTNNTFNITNLGMDASIKITIGNTQNWTFVNFTDRGLNKFCMNWSDDGWLSEQNIPTTGAVVNSNLSNGQSKLFDLKIFTPTAVSTIIGKEQWTIAVTATPS